MSPTKARLGGAILLLIAALLIGYGARGLAYASGLGGVHGHLRVLFCDQVWNGSRGGTHAVCNGTFRSDNGNITDTDAHLGDGLQHKMGESVPVTWAGGETYFTARPANAFGWATMLLAGAWAVACGAPALWVGRYARHITDAPRLIRASRQAARTAWWGAATCAAAALLALLVQNA
ncbi:hypothetical protein [Streptomyces sp. RPT161]|uniref:hypothetical protein n=1 Tax=Streptomyces sp. RPT161 TaxID=3015993 RepID=UPI0022B8B8B7|nr:hypothetical protein [Streptomyces sp. RPT161]